MNLHALWHICDYPWAVAADESSLTIRLRAARADVAGCELLHKCRYKWRSSYQRVPMKIVATDELYDYWQADCSVDRQRYRYIFELAFNGDAVGYFGERGFSETLIEDMYAFQFPYNAIADVYKGREWLQNGIVYQIFPDRFRNSGNSGSGIDTWGGKVNRHSRFGGNLKGITEKLPYIKELGADIVYLTPVFKSNTNHKYNTADYYQIDPQFGTFEDMKHLAQAAQQQGLHLVLDAVFNHCGDDFFAFRDCIEKGVSSSYWDWFFISGDRVDQKRRNYETFADCANMPKLNTANPQVREYLLDVACYWQNELDISGWRLDVCDEVDQSFWREFRRRIIAIKPDAAIIGEIMHHAQPWLRGEQFDGIMNYTFREAAIDFFARRKITAAAFASALDASRMLYSDEINRQLWNLLGSHDRPRLLDECGFRKKRARMALAFQFIYQGIPYIYYGDEAGLDGGNDPFCRKCMPWEESARDLKMQELVKTLCRLRREHSGCLERGAVKMMAVGATGLILARQDGTTDIYGLFNNSDTENTYEVPAGVYTDCLSGKKLHSEGSVVVKADGFRLLARI